MPEPAHRAPVSVERVRRDHGEAGTELGAVGRALSRRGARHAAMIAMSPKRVSARCGQKIDHLTSSWSEAHRFSRRRLTTPARGNIMRTIIAFVFVGLLCPGVVNGQTCGGFERWAVKVGSDPGITLVDFNNPVTATLHDLVNLPQPTMPAQGDNTTRTSLEHTVRVVDARLVQVKVEAGKDGDNDFHLVISDDTVQFSPSGMGSTPPTPLSHSFVAEIVNPDCVSGSHDDTTFPTQIQGSSWRCTPSLSISSPTC